MSQLFKAKNPKVAVRAVHLDLKGLPPTFKRLLKLLEVFKAAKYNALLVEWEDTYPWTVNEEFRSETAYTPDEVKAFYGKARELSFEFIPLVQCLGHMETPLRLPEYKHLRETADNSGDLNPLAAGAQELVKDMVTDALSLTPDCRYFHLGGDESWSFGTHPDTKAYVEKHGKGALYFNYVEPILDFLIERNVRPILWHDMMIEWDDDSLRKLGAKADLCVWGYRGRPETVDSHYNVKYVERFKSNNMPLWFGTAYKSGADGRADYIEHPEQREENALGWMEVADRFGAEGVIATAWSRSSTTNIQYFPIDAALDSLLRVAVILHDGTKFEGDRDTLLAPLESVNERSTFDKCHEAMRSLTRVRRECWAHVQILHELIVCWTQDERRRGSRVLPGAVERLRRAVESANQVAQTAQEAFQGLVPDIWMARFLDERLKPLSEQLAAMEARAVTIMEAS